MNRSYGRMFDINIKRTRGAELYQSVQTALVFPSRVETEDVTVGTKVAGLDLLLRSL